MKEHLEKCIVCVSLLDREHALPVDVYVAHVERTEHLGNAIRTIYSAWYHDRFYVCQKCRAESESNQKRRFAVGRRIAFPLIFPGLLAGVWLGVQQQLVWNLFLLAVVLGAIAGFVVGCVIASCVTAFMPAPMDTISVDERAKRLLIQQFTPEEGKKVTLLTKDDYSEISAGKENRYSAISNVLDKTLNELQRKSGGTD